MKTFEEYIEENPYDPSRSAEHFMTEQEHVDAELEYREQREKDVWDYQQKRIESLEGQVRNLQEKVKRKYYSGMPKEIRKEIDKLKKENKKLHRGIK